MVRQFYQVMLLLLTLCAAALVQAKVEVRPVMHKTVGLILVVNVSEDIAPGDYESLLKGLRANPGKFSRKIVWLNNIGGSVPEALKMGRLLRETGFDTMVPSTGVCQGSCVYLLAAGQNKTVRGYVGIHRPYYPHGDSALAGMGYSGQRYNTAGYWREMNIPSTLAEAIQRTPAHNMRVLTKQELASYRLN